MMSDPRGEIFESFTEELGIKEDVYDVAQQRVAAFKAADVGGVSAQQLKSLVDRIERLLEEKMAIAEDIKDVYAEAKGTGFDIKIIRKIITMRRRDRAELDEEETMLEIYLRALGMAPSGEDPDEEE